MNLLIPTTGDHNIDQSYSIKFDPCKHSIIFRIQSLPGTNSINLLLPLVCANRLYTKYLLISQLVLDSCNS